MPVFEQGAKDSLYAAKEAIELAIASYEKCEFTDEPLSTESGPLFEMLDHADTAQLEAAQAILIAKGQPS